MRSTAKTKWSDGEKPGGDNPTMEEVVGDGLWSAGDIWKNTWGRKENQWCIDPGGVRQVAQKK